MNNLTTSKVDRRRLDRQSRLQYQPTNRLKAVKRAKAYLGQRAQMANTRPNTTVPKRMQQPSEFRGHSDGLGVQQQRLREEGAKLQRAESLRPMDPA